MPKKSYGEEEQPKKIASYTVKLDDAQMEKLRAILEERGWIPFEVAYTKFAFKADHLKVNVSAYTSNKVVVAGKGTEAICSKVPFTPFAAKPSFLAASTSPNAVVPRWLVPASARQRAIETLRP